MSQKKCAREGCGKTVYPLEELKCLDKVWHKGCFKCTTCGMTLNMKNYKGLDKNPYCEAHVPKVKSTVVSDTPEMRRIAENTKVQSNIQYHAEFERSKGKKIEIADDPEVTRHLKNTQVISQAAYHGDVNRKKHMDDIRPTLEEDASRRMEAHTPEHHQPTLNNGHHHHQQQQQHQPPAQQQTSTPYSSKMASSGTVIYSSEQGGRVPVQDRHVGSIADYDPMNGQWGTVGSSKGQQQLNSPTSGGGKQAPGKFSYGGIGSGQPQQQPQQQQQQQQQQSPTKTKGFSVRALYDYVAQDTDEVSFGEGDVIVNCESIDDGWMTGTVQKSRKFGMLPANYVERIH